MPTYPDWFIEMIQSIANKRPRTVATHILEHGFITTEELDVLYGYKHPPRAARDLREVGVPLETYRVRNSEGRSIGAYRFGDLDAVRRDRLSGRKVFSKRFKEQMLAQYGELCSVCRGKFEGRYLQIDHRIPYEVAGDQNSGERRIQDYQLLCSECNRAKSWSCEHCPNLLDAKDLTICLNCYWATPEDYIHVALRDIRRVDVVWTGDEVSSYDRMREQAKSAGETMPDYVKRIINRLSGQG